MANGRSVLYVDLGFTSAHHLWREVALPAYERFTAAPNGGTALEAAFHAWHIHEWLWHDDQLSLKTTDTLPVYRQNLIGECPELAWVQDIAEAGKHRGLGRNDVQVKRAAQMPNFVTFNGHQLTLAGEPLTLGTVLQIELNDGLRYDVETILSRVVAFWQGKLGLDDAPVSPKPLETS